MGHYGTYLTLMDCLCSGIILRSMGLLLLALCCGGRSRTPLFHAWYTKKGYRLVSVIVLGTMVISSIVVVEGLEPFVKQRSNIDVVPVVDSYDGDIYYYNGYSTSAVYYTGHKIIKINGDESRWDDRDKLRKRSAEWAKISYGTSQ